MPIPKQKPGRSRQDYATPWPFVRAVEQLIGASFAIDLAASDANRKAPRFYSAEQNSLVQPWASDLDGAWGWCNPPYAHIEPWVAKALHEAEKGAKTVILLPAGVSTNWFAATVHMWACVLFVRPRLVFEGTTDPYPKDLMLIIHDARTWGRGYHVWDWTENGRKDLL